jgi:hypothetical protein
MPTAWNPEASDLGQLGGIITKGCRGTDGGNPAPRLYETEAG